MQHQNTHTAGFIGATALILIPGCICGLFIAGTVKNGLYLNYFNFISLIKWKNMFAQFNQMQNW
jgi:hypothetical protein